MKTRKEYLDGDCTHREFYAQFVTPGVLATVRRLIGQDRIARSVDPHFNDIPLKEWDALPASMSMSTGLKEAGDYLTLAGKVCIYKEAAQQIRDSAGVTT